MFPNLNVTDKMQYKTFKVAENSPQKTCRSAVCPVGGGSLNITMANYWL